MSLLRQRIRMIVPGAILLIAFVIMLSSLNGASNRSGKEIEIFTGHLSEICTHAVSSQIKAIEDVAFQFVANRDLNEVLVKYSLQQDRYQVAQLNMAFTNFLEGQAFFISEITNAIFWDYDDPTKKALTMREELANEAVLSLKLSSFASDIRIAGGKPVWIQGSLVNSALDDVLLMGRIVKHTLKETPLGYLVVAIKKEALITMAKNAAESNLYYSIGSVKDNLIAVIGQNPTSGVIAWLENASQDEIARIYKSLAPTVTILGAQNTTIRNKQYGEESLLIAISSIPGTEWHLMLPMTLRSSTEYAFHYDKGLVGNLISVAVAAIALMAFSYWWIGMNRIKTFAQSERPPGLAPSLGFSPIMMPSNAESLDDEETKHCESIASIVSKDKTGTLVRLTEKEIRLLCLIAKGYSNKRIADVMCVAEQTVKNSCSALYQKLGVEDRVGASVLATKLGLPLEGDEGRGQ